MRKSFVLSLLSVLALSLLLSGCGGGVIASSWPGITVKDGIAYVAYNQHIFAINTENGMEKWRYPVKADAKLTFYAPPVFTTDGQLLAASYNKSLFSLNPADGQANQGNWPFVGAANHLLASPLVTEDGIFQPSADATLYALDANGALRWSFKAGDAIWDTPVYDGKRLYFTSMDHRAYALDPKTGELIWKTDDLGGAMVCTPTLGPDGKLFVGTFNKELLALQADTGKVVNKFTAQGWIWSAPALVDGKLYFGDLEGFVYALNANDLSEIWRAQPDTEMEKQIPEKPLALNDTLYFSSTSGSLHALNIADGQVRFSKPFTQARLYSSPVAAGDLILVASVGKEQNLAALDASGNPKWTFPLK